MPDSIRFPDQFLWGAATSAYQIEGSPLADGAGESDWHRFAHTPGRIEDGATGDIACDHYRRYPEDVEIMSQIGLDAYRFSLAWARILPEGTGRVNRAGLDYYERLIDLLLKKGIRPCVTLHHWDLPGRLEDRGGWLDPDTAARFAEYANIVFRIFGDRVSMWATINEPWVIAHAGYLAGVHPPGRKNLQETAAVSHNLLMAHGLAVKAGRGESLDNIGLVVNLEPKYPASDSADDRAAAERADIYMNRQFLEPVLTGHYPEGLPAIYGNAWRDPSGHDLEIISEPIDYLGINYYTRRIVHHDQTVIPDGAAGVRCPGALYTDLDWEVHPESLTRILVWVKERYGDIPLYITENGAAFSDPPHPDGEMVEDPLRVDYYRLHLSAAHAAMREGVDLRGYFAWSLLDNLEWSRGYDIRFGLVHIDFETQHRTLKRSACFYRDVIRSHGAVLDRSP